MTTVAQWLAAPLVQVERGEREAFARGLYDHVSGVMDDVPSGSCDCGVLAPCRRHRLAGEQRDREQADRLARFHASS